MIIKEKLKLLNAVKVHIKFFIKRKIYKNDGFFYCIGKLNIGDSFVPYLLDALGLFKNEKVVNNYQNQLETSGEVFFSVGSVLQWANSNSIVWGSGLISKESICKSMPKKVLALRGWHTKNILEKKFSVNIDVALGDPGLLISDFITIKCEKKYKYGLILHYVDKIILDKCILPDNCLIIDIETDNINKFVTDINSCEKIISSSLHGLIFADSYCIPNAFILLSDKVFGGLFKFNDYFSVFSAIRPVNDCVKSKDLRSLKYASVCSTELQYIKSDLKTSLNKL